MLKINPIRTMALATALTASVALAAQNRIQKNADIFQAETFSNVNKDSGDVFVPQAKTYYIQNTNVNNVKKANRAYGSANPDFDKAVDFYNDKMTSSQRYSVTQNTEKNLAEKLHKVEQDIDKAYQDCEAFNDPNLMVVRFSPYRYFTYPRWYDKLLNFDLNELREQTTKDMNSINEIREKVEYIMEEAKGETEHTVPAKTEYDVDAIAKKHLGMSYKEFAAKYPNELENCKYMTYSGLYNMDETQSYVYSRAKSYAAEMLDITMQEAHNTHWDIQERILYESMEASGDIYTISEFEYDGITNEGLKEINSKIMYKSFEDALIAKYKELNPDETAINDIESAPQIKKPVKRNVNGKVLIFQPNGSVYDLNGQKIK